MALMIDEFENAKVYCKSDAIGDHQGRTEIYENWVRLVSGPGSAVWVPREDVEQIHES